MNPGGPDAVKAGCKCPIIDNGHGVSPRPDGGFVFDCMCPVHGEPAINKKLEEQPDVLPEL